MDPRGMVGRVYKEDHYTLLHTKYESSGPCCFEADFFPYCKSMGAICCHGNQNSDQTLPETYHNLSPTPIMLQTKFACNWPCGLRDVNI